MCYNLIDKFRVTAPCINLNTLEVLVYRVIKKQTDRAIVKSKIRHSVIVSAVDICFVWLNKITTGVLYCHCHSSRLCQDHHTGSFRELEHTEIKEYSTREVYTRVCNRIQKMKRGQIYGLRSIIKVNSSQPDTFYG